MIMLEWIKHPWPWYVGGPLIGLAVPLLLLFGNKRLGVSSSLRHICALCLPANIQFFKYDWRRELWNLFFVAGITAGAFVALIVLSDHQPVQVNPRLVMALKHYGITNYSKLAPADIFNWSQLVTIQRMVLFNAASLFTNPILRGDLIRFHRIHALWRSQCDIAQLF